jgi:hypothetical protein
MLEFLGLIFLMNFLFREIRVKIKYSNLTNGKWNQIFQILLNSEIYLSI